MAESPLHALFVRSLAAALLAGLVGASGAGVLPAAAQQGPAPDSGTRPPPVQSAPLPPPTGPATPAPAAPEPPATPPGAPAPSSPSTAQPAPGQPTLVPTPGDPMNVDEVTLTGRPAAVLSGTSTWDDGFTSLKNAFQRIEEELKRAGLAPAGRPLAVFTETDDLGFRFEAMIPVNEIPAGRIALSPEVRFGRTPDGKALRFVHKAPYDEIDSTYETITAYLDAKGVVVKDAFIEEYLTPLNDPDDPNLEINIFVQPK